MQRHEGTKPRRDEGTTKIKTRGFFFVSVLRLWCLRGSAGKKEPTEQAPWAFNQGLTLDSRRRRFGRDAIAQGQLRARCSLWYVPLELPRSSSLSVSPSLISRQCLREISPSGMRKSQSSRRPMIVRSL